MTLLLGACNRAPVEAPSDTPELAAPEPSSAFISSPLNKATTGFTNEMQAANFTRETTELGIQEVGKAVEEPEPERPPTPRSRAQEKAQIALLKQMRMQVSGLRHGMESARDRSVALEGRTAAIIKGRESGGVMEAMQDAPGVWSGAYGGAVETGERLVSDAAVWAELWGRVSRETPPEVDFATTRIAAVFVGPRPTGGYRARLLGIAAEPTRYLVRWFEEGPAPDEVVTDGATAPFLLVAVPKDDRAVRWEKKRRDAKQVEGPKTR